MLTYVYLVEEDNQVHIFAFPRKPYRKHIYTYRARARLKYRYI